MTRERNWADNYTFKAARIHRPGSSDEVRRLVARADKIHAIGTRHSFNGIADSSGDLADSMAWLRRPLYPFRFVNVYHLFGSITRERIEPEFQTSDGTTWSQPLGHCCAYG